MQLKKMSVLFFVLIFFSLPIAVAGEAMQIDHEMHLAHAPSLSEIQAFQPLTSKNVEEGDYNITLEMACRLISANWCHAMNYTGKGIRVAIIEWNDDPNTTTPNDNDNGFYTDNDAPYYD
jgi:hypothetical protein